MIFNNVLKQKLDEAEVELGEMDPDTEEFYDLIDLMGAWEEQLAAYEPEKMNARIDKVFTGMGFSKEDMDRQVDEFSGGWQMRIALGKLLLQGPSLLILDEPTNHLDIPSIETIEKFLKEYPKAFILVSHDRLLIDRVCTTILDVNQQKIDRYHCNYSTFQTRKAHALEVQEKQEALFDKRLAQEETWIRQGIKARRTRNEGRVRSLKAMRLARAKRPSKMAAVALQKDVQTLSSRRVIVAENIAYQWHNTPLIPKFSTTIMRQDKVGIVGPNGCGKSTLIKLLLKKIPLQQGTIKHGQDIQLAYFDQMRQDIDPEKTLIDNVISGSETIEFNGQSLHIIGYLKRFLFSPQQARSKAKTLSGGQNNRLMLAKLLTQEANLLVLDEPTNDLDIESLELLEQLLVDYQGTLLVISHDRTFLDHVTTSIISFDTDGQLREYVGGFSDIPQKVGKTTQATQPTSIPAVKSKPLDKSNRPSNKLSYHEQRQLTLLPQEIEHLEHEIAQLQQTINQPSFYQQAEQDIKDAHKQLSDLNDDLAQKYALWETLEEKKF